MANHLDTSGHAPQTPCHEAETIGQWVAEWPTSAAAGMVNRASGASRAPYNLSSGLPKLPHEYGHQAARGTAIWTSIHNEAAFFQAFDSPVAACLMQNLCCLR